MKEGKGFVFTAKLRGNGTNYLFGYYENKWRQVDERIKSQNNWQNEKLCKKKTLYMKEKFTIRRMII